MVGLVNKECVAVPNIPNGHGRISQCPIPANFVLQVNVRNRYHLSVFYEINHSIVTQKCIIFVQLSKAILCQNASCFGRATHCPDRNQGITVRLPVLCCICANYP